MKLFSFAALLVGLAASMFLDDGKTEFSEIEKQFIKMREIADNTVDMQDDVQPMVVINVLEMVQVDASLWLKYRLIPYQGEYGTIFVVPYESLKKYDDFLIVGKINYRYDNSSIRATYIEWNNRYIYNYEGR